jgi:ketosteroid isomerase-like protein
MLRHLTIIPACALALTAVSCAPDPAREESAAVPAAPAVATTGEDVESAISQLERDWVAAIVNKDRAALDRLLADDFAGTSPSAHLYNKKMAIEDLSTGTYAVESMDLDEIAVNVYGDTAVAFASQNEKSRYGSTDISGHYHYTNVWVKKDGRWQAVASHGTRYQAGHQEAGS